MSKSFKLDDIKAAAEKRYANTEIDMGEGSPVLLRNVLQLTEEERKSLTEKPEGDASTQLEEFRRMIRVIASSPEGAERLIEAFGENLAYYAQAIEFYNEESETGEA